MPNEVYDWLPQKQLMSADEVIEIAQQFVAAGVTKIRLTGGEPLVRKDFAEIVERLSALPIKIALTTNGVLIDRHLETLKRCGVKSINLSLDTLQKEKFNSITQRDWFDKAWKNLKLLVQEGFHVKINAVALKGFNDDEILSFIALTEKEPVHVRFIEFMPFDGNRWKLDQVITYQEMLDEVRAKYTIEKLDDRPHATTKSYRVKGGVGTFAVISTVTEPFCSSCNRLRITAEGKMRNCLFSKKEADLLQALRAGEDLQPIIRQVVRSKAKKLGGLPEFEIMMR